MSTEFGSSASLPVEPTEEGPIDRRAFCLHACRVASLSALVPLIQSCGGSPTSPSFSAPPLPSLSGNVVNGQVTVTVDAASPLANVGGAALVRSSQGEFLVTRTGATAAIALTAVCTHEGCTVSGIDNAIFVCGCHGSRFSPSGSVLNGPATRSLRSFATTVDATTLTITL